MTEESRAQRLLRARRQDNERRFIRSEVDRIEAEQEALPDFFYSGYDAGLGRYRVARSDGSRQMAQSNTNSAVPLGRRIASAGRANGLRIEAVPRRDRMRPEPIPRTESTELYIVDSQNSKLKFLQRNGSIVTLAEGLGTLPIGLAVASSGTAYVSDSLSGTIYRVPPSGAPEVLADNSVWLPAQSLIDPSIPRGPYRLCLDPSESYLYVVDTHISVHRLNIATQEAAATIIVGAPGPAAIACDQDGVYLSFSSSAGVDGRIYRLDLDISGLESIIYTSSGASGDPFEIERIEDIIASDGRLYVCGAWERPGPTYEGFVKSLATDGSDIRVEWRGAARPTGIAKIRSELYGAIAAAHEIQRLKPKPARFAGTGIAGDLDAKRRIAQLNTPYTIRGKANV